MRYASVPAGIVVSLAALAAQTPSPQQPTFRVEANFVRVDVYPTQNGQPVLDLRAEDFDVLEEGRPQRIETFEHVRIRAAGALAERVEPNNQRESDAMAADPRNRVFVLFLDTSHVEVGASRSVTRPLVAFLDRVIGQGDLVGVMTPDMSAADLVLARKTTTIEGILTRYWYWGERDQLAPRDPEEIEYQQCYPGFGPDPNCSDDDRGVAEEMIARRRERRTLDALEDLVVHLRGLREERKAILVVSDGWKLFGSNPALARRLYCAVPGTPEVFVDPRTGRIATRDQRNPQEGGRSKCDGDRLRLSQLDDDRQFRNVLDAANRANASFYSVDPRGLAVFDTPMEPGRPLSLSADAAQLRNRLLSLRMLADATDGFAVVGSNDLEAGLKRIVADLNSYYLLGYYSDSGKLDGKFRSITVRVKRPGVDVRARRGYRAPTEKEVRVARVPAVPAPSEHAGIAEALASLAAIRPEVRLWLRVAWAMAGSGASASADGSRAGLVWLVGEIATDLSQWVTGGAAMVLVTDAGGSIVAQGRATIPAAKRTFVAEIPTPLLAPGEYAVQVRAAPRGGDPLQDIVRFVIKAPGPGRGAALVLRRGPFAPQSFEPTADMRFRRNERLRIDVPADESSVALSAQMFDRSGTPLAIPLSTGEREDSNGRRWLTAELALAPLAPGDYVVQWATGPLDEIGAAVAFRVMP